MCGNSTKIAVTMRPIIIHTRHFPPRGFHAITIFPFVFFTGEKLTERDMRHETVHLWQQGTLLIAPFYLLYILFWIVNLIKYRDNLRAYYNIPFERSAYALEKNSEVHPMQQAFDWVHHIK